MFFLFFQVSCSLIQNWKEHRHLSTFNTVSADFWQRLFSQPLVPFEGCQPETSQIGRFACEAALGGVWNEGPAAQF